MGRQDAPTVNGIRHRLSLHWDKPYWIAVCSSAAVLVLWVWAADSLPAWLGILLVAFIWPAAVVWPKATEASLPLSLQQDADRELWHLVVEIDQLVAPEIVELRELIDQGSHLIDNATNELQACFADLTASTQSQHILVNHIVQRLSSTSPAGTDQAPALVTDLTSLDNASASVQEHIHTAVRLLQFEDITQQVLGRVRLRIDFMERFVAELRQLPLVEPGHSAAQIEQARQRLQALREELRAAVYRPVSQTSMNEGDVELF